jgi:hypothetical protein
MIRYSGVSLNSELQRNMFISFLNNWISFHEISTTFLQPFIFMACPHKDHSFSCGVFLYQGHSLLKSSFFLFLFYFFLSFSFSFSFSFFQVS